MNRSRRAGAAVIILAGVLCAGSIAPSQTEAAWTDRELGQGTFASGTVSAPTGLRCAQSGLLQPVIYAWTSPAGGLPRTGYRWTITGGLTGNGTLPANATSVTLFSSGLLVLGSGTFSLSAVGPGGWESPVATGSVSVLSVVLGVTSFCSVP